MPCLIPGTCVAISAFIFTLWTNKFERLFQYITLLSCAEDAFNIIKRNKEGAHFWKGPRLQHTLQQKIITTKTPPPPSRGIDYTRVRIPLKPRYFSGFFLPIAYIGKFTAMITLHFHLWLQYKYMNFICISQYMDFICIWQCVYLLSIGRTSDFLISFNHSPIKVINIVSSGLKEDKKVIP